MKRFVLYFASLVAAGTLAILAYSQIPASFVRSGMIFGTPQAQGTGALVLLEQHTASNTAALNFTSWYSSSYDDYLIEFVNVIPVTNSAEFRLQVSTDGGATYEASNYASALFYTGSQGGGYRSGCDWWGHIDPVHDQWDKRCVDWWDLRRG